METVTSGRTFRLVNIYAVHIVAHLLCASLQSHVWNSDFGHLIYIRLVIQLGSNLIFFLWSCYFFTSNICMWENAFRPNPNTLSRVFGCMISFFAGRHMPALSQFNAKSRKISCISAFASSFHSFGILFRSHKTQNNSTTFYYQFSKRSKFQAFGK